MVEFLTLFLGIVAGPQQVSLAADEQVTRVEIRLDGESLAEDDAPPWDLEVDLGTELLPHVLEAVAFGQDGQEVARARQLLNVPRDSSEVSLVLQRQAHNQLEAQIAWESASGDQPVEKSALLDGVEVPILDGERVDLSGLDTQQLHVLQVELWFPGLSSARGHVVFGGEYVDETNAELTALPVAVVKGTIKSAGMDGWLTADNQPAQVTAVEKGLTSLTIVRSPGVAGLIRTLPGQPRATPTGQSGGLGPVFGRSEPTTGDYLRTGISFADDCRVRLVAPRALTSAGKRVDFDLFSVSPEIRSRQGGMFWLLSQEVQLGGTAGGTRLHDALTLAGLMAAGSNHRRAVLLILAGPWEDQSRFEAASVRRFLDALNVPLIVWQLEVGAAVGGDWGPRVEISDYGDLKRAWRALEKRLNRQRVVWIEGLYLPNAVRIAKNTAIVPVTDDN